MRNSLRPQNVAAILLLSIIILPGCVGEMQNTAFSLSGRVVDSSGAGLADTVISLSGAQSESVTTKSDGSYRLTGLGSGNYTVTPSKTGYSFTPAGRSVTVGSADVAGLDFTGTITADKTFGISGRITIAEGEGLAGVAVSLTGANTGSVSTDANGAYSYSNFANGTYTLTPSKTGWDFVPVSITVTINNSDVTAPGFMDFTATPIPAVTYSISGRVTGSGAGISGVNVNLSGLGAQTAAVTDSNGDYTFAGLQNGSYSVTPSKTGYDFTPGSMTVAVDNADVSAIDFTATPATPASYSISGRVTSSGVGLSGVNVNLSGGSATASTVTDANGNYILTDLQNGLYEITPSKAGYTFTLASRVILISDADVTDQDFTAASATYNVSGKITLSGGAGHSGVWVTLALSGHVEVSVITDAGGNYTFTGIQNGTYTITPDKSGYTFLPASKTVDVIGANVIDADFESIFQGIRLTVGPVDPVNGFPAWYQDETGLALAPCFDNNGFCSITMLAGPGFDPAQPIAFPTNFPEEFFYFATETFAGSTLYIAALEGAFINNAVQAGDQIVFARIRIRDKTAPAGDYTITHPYGVDTITVTSADVASGHGLMFTEDIGVAPGIFSGPGSATTGRIGPFLRAATGLVTSLDGKVYVGNGISPAAVTGTPVTDVTVQGPSAFGTQTSNSFILEGKVISSASEPKAVVKINTTGTLATGARIGGIEITLALPAGVSVTFASADVVVASGVAVGSHPVIAAYSPTMNTVRIAIISPEGFGIGEFVTVNCDIAPGTNVAPSGFSTSGFSALNLDGTPITGLTAGLTVNLQ